MKDEINFYNREYYKKHEFVFKTEDRADIKRILELLTPKKTDRILEIGCGFGVLLNKFSSKKKVGIETNDTALKECKKRGLKVIKADAEKGLPFKDSSFDIVIMNEVISHLKKPEYVLQESYRVLTSKGKIILTAPIKSFFFNNISQTHLSEMNSGELKKIATKAGFKILSHEANGISFLYPLLETFLFRPFRFLRYFLNKKRKRSKDAGIELIDSCHGLADKTFLKPLSVYRKSFLNIGLNQIILAQKRETMA